MRYAFVKSTLKQLLKKGILKKEDHILAVCSGRPEHKLFMEMKFRNVTISNLDERIQENDFVPFEYRSENVQNLSFKNRSFDYIFVSDGLHHCRSPHIALLEMVRVSKKGIIVFESRDSFLMRTAVRLKLTFDYEVAAVATNNFQYGGVNNSHIPNFIYRWTEREFKKTIQSNLPEAMHQFYFFYGLNLPYDQLKLDKSKLKYYLLCGLAPFLAVFGKIFKTQCNSFCMIAMNPDIPKDLFPWLKMQNDQIQFNQSYAKEHYQLKKKSD